MTQVDHVLAALRRVIQAADIHSKRLTRTTGLTAPQLLLLQAIDTTDSATIGVLAKQISLSQATVTNIITRLESRGLVRRRRSTTDKRFVYLDLTDSGCAALARSPKPLQESFGHRFAQLPDWEKTMILCSLQKLAHLMDAGKLDASPILDVGPLDRPDCTEQLEEQEEEGKK